MAQNNEPQIRLKKLNAVLEGAKSLLIVMQNNPDPDAIAAAAALREIANNLHSISCSLAHSGIVGRAENQALLAYLNLNMRPLDTVHPDRFDRIAMVDAQPGAGNVDLDPTVPLDIVIDHHPIRRETRSARFTDVRSRYGATSTIMHEYLLAAGIDIAPKIATALVYGIRSDTQDLGRDSTRHDVQAFLDLYPEANVRALGRIVSAELPRTYFARLRNALDRAIIHGDRIVSCLGTLESPDMVAEAADFLLRVEGVSRSICLGEVDGWVHASLRASDRSFKVGVIARKLAARRGYGGGHHMLAAVQIPPRTRPTADGCRSTVKTLTTRFLKLTGGGEDEAGVPLCDAALCDRDEPDPCMG
ncbi:MAG: phosphoesterase [bacterium]|nr:phosphoesterase [bacterium]